MGQSGLSPIKLLWTGCAIAVVPIVLVGIQYSKLRVAPGIPKLLVLSAALFSAQAIAFLVSHSNGATIGDFSRGISAYLLLSISPFLAVWLAERCTIAQLERILVTSGLLASISYLLYWLSGRGIISLERLPLFPASSMLFAFFFYSVVKYRSTGTLLWGLAVVFETGVLALNGSRTLLLIAAIVAIVGFVFGTSASGDHISAFRRVWRLVSVLFVLSATVAALAATKVLSLSLLMERYGGIASVVGDAGGDESGGRRLTLSRFAWDMFKQKPFLGWGPGGFENRFYPWALVNQNATFILRPLTEYRSDTPLVMLPIFGIFGTACIIVFLFSLWSTIRNLGGESRETYRSIVRLWSLTFILLLPVMILSDEKTFGIAVALTLSMALREWMDHSGQVTGDG
jgi:O-antigen ligase